MALQRTPSRFSKPTYDSRMWVGPTSIDRICFSVDQDDVNIWGVGALCETETTATARLDILDDSSAILASTTCQVAGVQGSDMKFDRCCPIKKNVKYTLELTYQTKLIVRYGESGESTVMGPDGTKFLLSNASNSSNTDTATGQFPCFLYSRGSRSITRAGLSYQKANVELPLPLKEASFTKASKEVKLQRFMFSVTAQKKEGQLSVTLKCRPTVRFEGWCIETETSITLVHPNDHTKSKSWQAKSAFKETTESSSVVDVSFSSLEDPGFKNDVILEVSIRYDKKDVPSPDVPTEETLDFGKPWQESDVVLTFDDGKELHCHKTILSLASPVLSRMLTGDFKESSDKKINLKGKSSGSFEKLLRLTYHRETSADLDEETAIELVQLFHEYEMVRLERKAEQILVEGVEKLTALKYLSIAYPCGFDDLTERCLEVAATLTAQEVKGDNAYYLLDDDARGMVHDARMTYGGLS